MNVPVYGQLSFTKVYLYHYKSRIKYLLEKIYDPKLTAKMIYSFVEIGNLWRLELGSKF